MKVYKKRGNKNYKERRLLKELEPIIQRKIEEDPSFAKEIVPATNFDELKKLHSRYVAEDVAFEEVEPKKEEEINDNNIEKDNTKEDMAKKNYDEVEDVAFEETPKEETPKSNQFIDPFNREEPIVRDYVLGNDSLSKGSKSASDEPAKTFFDEPTSFEEAFEIPNSDAEEEAPSSSKSKSKERDSSDSNSVNPSFDNMKAGKQKRSTKKFAKYIVEAVAMLSEKGFVYFANSDINESKLAEYELSGEMDLSLLVSLENGQEVTVKQFFQSQCQKAEMMSKWNDEQKDDLSAALAEVLLEKGAAPTPTQELLLVTLTIIGGQAMTLLTIKSETNSLLNQLRSMNEGGNKSFEADYTEVERETPTQTPTPKTEEVNEDFIEPETEGNFDSLNELATLSEEDVLISDAEILTKE